MKKVKCICWCGRGGCGADITGDTCCVFHVAYSDTKWEWKMCPTDMCPTDICS